MVGGHGAVEAAREAAVTVAALTVAARAVVATSAGGRRGGSRVVSSRIAACSWRRPCSLVPMRRVCASEVEAPP